MGLIDASEAGGLAAIRLALATLSEGDCIVTGHRSEGKTVLRLRRIGRALGTLVAGFWVFIGVLETIAGSEPWTAESSILAMLIVGAALAVGVAWWREGIGGFLLLLVGAAYCAFAFVTAGHNKLFEVAITGVPFLLVGLLFLGSWLLSRRAEPAQG